jgi:hypothetical protein
MQNVETTNSAEHQLKTVLSEKSLSYAVRRSQSNKMEQEEDMIAPTTGSLVLYEKSHKSEHHQPGSTKTLQTVFL